MDAWVSVIESLGFPIAMCVVCVFALKYIFDMFMKKSEQEAQLHKEEVNTMTEALNNNTIVLQKLCDKLGVEESLDAVDTEVPSPTD